MTAGRYDMTAADAVRPGEVIALRGSGAWRIVTDTHAPRHPAAEYAGAVVLELVDYVTGRTMPPATVFPADLVAVVPASWLERVTR